MLEGLFALFASVQVSARRMLPKPEPARTNLNLRSNTEPYTLHLTPKSKPWTRQLGVSAMHLNPELNLDP